jgi:hypothetical protein
MAINARSTVMIYYQLSLLEPRTLESKTGLSSHPSAQIAALERCERPAKKNAHRAAETAGRLFSIDMYPVGRMRMMLQFAVELEECSA